MMDTEFTESEIETETADSLGFQSAPAAVRIMTSKAVGTRREC